MKKDSDKVYTYVEFSQVAMVHGQFIQALEALFEKYKAELGFGRTSLLIK